MVKKNAIILKVLNYEEKSSKSLLLAKDPKGSDKLIKVSTFFMAPEHLVGQNVIIEGKESHDFFEATSIVTGKDLKLLPFIKDVFDGKSISGLTPEIRKALFDHYGNEWPKKLNLLGEGAINALSLAPFHKKTAISGWSNFKKYSQEYAVLRNNGMNHRQALNSITSFGNKSKKIIYANPYSLTYVKGVGFQTVDKIAIDRGVPFNSQERLKNILLTSIERLENQGSTLFNTRYLSGIMSRMAGISFQESLNYVEQASSSQLKKIKTENNGTGLIKSSTLNQSIEIAKELKRLTKGGNKIDTTIKPQDIPSPFPLKEGQIEAVKKSLSSKVSVITGRPGTGKSTIANQVIKGMEMEGSEPKIASCALSGKAARRLAETTGKPAQTIHSLLGFKPGEGFKFSKDNKLDIDAIVIDEASMIDEGLFLALLKAVPDTAKVIIMGDYEQLPSVNPGQVLKDIIHSQTIPVSRLTEITRIKPGNTLIPVAHQIADGKVPDLNTKPGENFQWINASNDEEIIEIIQDLVKKEINNNNVNPNEIQILTPQMKKGPGTIAINQSVSEFINQNPKRHISMNHLGETYHVGDRVMQTNKNDYELGVNNGDIGIIDSIDFNSRTVHMEMAGEKKEIPFNKMGNMVSANAITIHKSQGSEYPIVIIPISKSHENMLNIELVYTALTRGKQKVYMVGDESALRESLSHRQNKKRSTALQSILKNELLLNKERNYQSSHQVAYN